MIYVLSGGSSLFSVIAVTYPSGSICTCGGKAAKDTSGYALFNVKPGTYTVECHTSDGSKNKSTSVTVTERDIGKAIIVALTYELVLFDNGAYASETGGWNDITNNKLDVSTSSTSMNGNPKHIYTKKSVDLSKYTTLHFILDSTSSTRNQWREVGVSNTKTGSFNANVEINNSSVIGEHTLNISNISKSQYIHLACDAWPSNNGAYAGTSMVISKIWLS